MTQLAVKIGAGGRFVIPGEYRDVLGIKTGDTVIVVLEEDGLRVQTAEQAVAQAQALVAKYVPQNRSLVDELIAERREEADGS